jgi:hypothetical protein
MRNWFDGFGSFVGFKQLFVAWVARVRMRGWSVRSLVGFAIGKSAGGGRSWQFADAWRWWGVSRRRRF